MTQEANPFDGAPFAHNPGYVSGDTRRHEQSAMREQSWIGRHLVAYGARVTWAQWVSNMLEKE